MAYSQATARLVTEQAPPVVRDLESVFAALEDSDLIEYFTGPIRRGPKGHSVRVLWRCFVAKHRMGVNSTDAFIRALGDNPHLAAVCGVSWPDGIPHKSTFSRFFAKLSKNATALKMVKNVSRALVRKHQSTIPGFGRRVAIDSTTLKGWANGMKGKRVDPDAGWSIKTNSQGQREYTFGWKLHLMVGGHRL